MSSLEDEHRAQEAKRLLNEPLLAEAIEGVRNEALEALSSVDATDVSEVIKLQAVANVCLELVIRLNRYLLPIQAQAGGDDGQTG